MVLFHFPHGTGKQVRVLVLCTPDAEAAAKEAGADYVGLDEYIEKIKGGWVVTPFMEFLRLWANVPNNQFYNQLVTNN